jgi:hypothetical protein
MKINYNTMKDIHNLSEWKMMEYLEKDFPNIEFLPTRPGRQLLYINNNSPVLAVAHLDGTMPASHFAVGESNYKPGHKCIFSPMVDDRLGAYTILYLLPQLGINVDILLSEGEEVGDPTSQWFEPRRKYNWMFQFDRGGTDAVHYQYTEKSWVNVLNKYFNKVSYGLFSDIAFMDHLNIQGVNVGTAYYNYTEPEAFASLNELASQIRKFEKFYDRYKDVRFVTPKHLRNHWWV